MAEKYFRISDLRKLCDDSRDWGVPTFTAKEIAETVLVRCKNCIHRPDVDEQGNVIPPKMEVDVSDWRTYPGENTVEEDDWTCPFLNHDDDWWNEMPKDDFYCAYGE